MFTQRHYIEIARIIRQEVDIKATRPLVELTGAGDRIAYDRGYRSAIENIARELAHNFRDDNERFDYKRFMTACGLED